MGNFNSLIFPKPSPPSYTAASLPSSLILIPRALPQNLDSKSKSKNGDSKAVIPCLFLESLDPSDKMIIYYHGNASDIGKSLKFCKRLASGWNINILVVEYPSYGIYLQGKTPLSEKNILEDTTIVYDYLTLTRGIKHTQILVMGRSIGSGPAVHLSSCRRVAGLILFSPFMSIQKVVRSKMGRLAALAVKDKFKNYKKIKAVECPVMFLHGDQDKIVPASHSQRLYKLADRALDRSLFIREGMTHG